MLVKRNLQLFFRDGGNVVASLMGGLVLLVMYVLFLGDMMTEAMQAEGFYSDYIRLAISGIMFGGMVALTSLSSSMGAVGIGVADKEKAMKDFLTSPVSRKKITLSYIVSSSVVGFVITGVVLILSVIYIAVSSSNLPGMVDWGRLLLTIALSALCANAMGFFLSTFVKTQAAFAAITAVVGMVVGFIMGIFIPIGQLPGAMQWVIRLFPMSHSVSMFRQILADGALTTAFAGAPEALGDFREMFGLVFTYGDYTSSFLMSAVVLAGTTVLFYALSLTVMAKRKA